MVWEAMGESWEMSREEERGCTRDWEGSERGEDEESGLEGVVSGLDSETDDSFFDYILDIIEFDSSFDCTGVDIFDPTVTSSPPPDRFTAPRRDTRS